MQLSEFVRQGVSLLVRDSGGCSALHIAAQKGHTELVSYILQQGEAVGDVRVYVCSLIHILTHVSSSGSKVLLDLADREKYDESFHFIPLAFM